jgi:phage-related holin
LAIALSVLLLFTASDYLLGKVSSNFSESHRLSFREKYYSENINVIVLLKVKKKHLFDNNKNVIAVFGTWGLRGRDRVVVGFTAT